MKERGILFQKPMVQAIRRVESPKTQTRRAVKGLTEKMWIEETASGGFAVCYDGEPSCGSGVWDVKEYSHPIACPYGVPGDRLWVRETFYAWGRWETRYDAKKKRDAWVFIDMTKECERDYLYVADTPSVQPLGGRRSGSVTPKWWKRPAIHMPRVACRQVLEITEVRAERLQDISEADSRAEGITDGGCTNCGEPEPCNCAVPAPSARDAYCHLWGQINGPDSWAANPWVWAVSFRRIEP